MHIETRAFGASDIGRERERNEDALLLDNRLGLYVVCDGMGGHAAGEVAARIATETIHEVVKDDADLVERVRRGKEAHDRLYDLCGRAINEACRRVYDSATSDRTRAGMGCTVTMLIVAGSRAAMGHVGDTSLFLCRDEHAEQLTMEHTMAAELTRSGVMTPDVAAASRYSHVLSRAIGTQPAVESDRLIFDVLPDDTYLLCSDGLTRYLEGEGELSSLLTDDDLERIPASLIDMANERGGRDNITTVVVRVEAPADEQEEQAGFDADVRARLAAVRRAELFSKLSFANASRVLKVAELRSADAGQTVVARGTPAAACYIVVDGRFVVEDGEASRRLERGDTFGEQTLLYQRPASASLRAETSGRLLILSGERFQKLVKRRPFLGVTLLVRLGRLLSRELERG